MKRVTIANAVTELESLLEALDDAYWESSQITHKDIIYDLINTCHQELRELAKLSINDHSMAYEPVTSLFRNAMPKLKNLHGELPSKTLRAKTADKLNVHIPEVIRLLTSFDY